MSEASSGVVAVSRPMVKALFVASCLLSIVSWYTTQQGMALYLAPWFALLASLGVQSALVLVAWLIGLTRAKRALLIAVYAITALVSISFSYACLYTWFSARERPATIERKLYEALNTSSGQAQELLANAISEGQKHVYDDIGGSPLANKSWDTHPDGQAKIYVVQPVAASGYPQFLF